MYQDEFDEAEQLKLLFSEPIHWDEEATQRIIGSFNHRLDGICCHAPFGQGLYGLSFVADRDTLYSSLYV